MLKIKTQTNNKLLQNFHNQPYPDLCIVTTESKLNLARAYLSIDSGLFSDLDADVVEVNLSFLPEDPLIKVLQALYGDELVVSCISELKDMYKVISQLEIEDFKKQIQIEISKRKELMENLQILQFCFNNTLLIAPLKQFYFQNNLKPLEDNRNYLQLSKISLQTLIPLLIEYLNSNYKTVSVVKEIMENYFNRNSIRPADFFSQYDNVEILQNVWEQFYHSLQIDYRRPTKIKSSELINQIPKSRLNENYEVKKTKTEDDILEQKNMRIQELTEKSEEMDRTIERLNRQLQEIKKTNNGQGVVMKRIPSIPILPYQDKEISILEGVRNMKRQKLFKNKKDAEETNNEPAFEKIKSSKNLHQPKFPRS